jgi:chorismate synthase
MAGNSIGQVFQFTSFGESHGPVIGGVIDGCPPGIELNFDDIITDLARRKPGGRLSTKRKETDMPEFLSGLIDLTTTGAPIAFIIPNKDAKPEDYDYLKETYRPSHADYTYHKKYGLDDHRLVHRASARETVVRVVAGAIAKQVLARGGIFIAGITSCIGQYSIDHEYSFPEMEKAGKTSMQCPDQKLSRQMAAYLKKLQKEGDSIGCEVQVTITGVPPGLGEPVFNKLQSSLAAAVMSINAAVAFDFGLGRYAAWMKGSEYNDLFTVHDGHIRTATNNSGGIQAGISNGEDIIFRVIFKPIPTIGKEQHTVSRTGKPMKIKGRGRHDVCASPRVVPVVEAMAAIALLDQLLLAKTSLLT